MKIYISKNFILLDPAMFALLSFSNLYTSTLQYSVTQYFFNTYNITEFSTQFYWIRYKYTERVGVQYKNLLDLVE